jgi:hypothetical protein
LIEEIAALYNRGLLDKAFTKGYFGDLAKERWDQGAWYFESDPAYYGEWRRMLEDMARSKRKWPRWRWKGGNGVATQGPQTAANEENSETAKTSD